MDSRFAILDWSKSYWEAIKPLLINQLAVKVGDEILVTFLLFRLCLVCAFCVHAWAQNAFQPFFFFLLSAIKVDFFNCVQCICVLFMGPQISLFINFFIKNGSHDTIHTFKNYFATMFFSFQFQFSIFSCIQTDPLSLWAWVLDFKYTLITYKTQLFIYGLPTYILWT